MIYLDSAVAGARDNLGISRLGFHCPNCSLVARETMDLILRTHIPDLQSAALESQASKQYNNKSTYSCDSISTTRHKHIQRWVQLKRKHAREMAVVASDDLVVLEIPAYSCPYITISLVLFINSNRCDRPVHSTFLSSPAENRYGWRGLTSRPRMALM